jgi:hypothetical protein
MYPQKIYLHDVVGLPTMGVSETVAVPITHASQAGH